MNKFTKFVCKHKTLILIITLLLLIPSLIGIKQTKINYDILVYLPKDIETIKGQNILTDDFKMGAFSISIIDNMEAKDVLKLENKIKKVDGVNDVLSLYDVVGTTIPIEMLPSEVTQRLTKGNSSLLMITFKDGTSDEDTLNAVTEIRKITQENIKISGMSSMVLDTMNLSNKEMVSYVIIAVILCLIVLMLSLDSYIVPFLLLLNIGIAILFNMGTNVFLGNISYITKAISAVLQLGVTTDFSIFLYHKYEKCKKENKNNKKAMEKAIKETITAVTGSSLTTIAGFLALCFMTLTLGKDIGIVMAKGVLFGVICVVTVFPSLLLVFDGIITKTTHKVILPSFKNIKNFTIKHYKTIFTIFLIMLIPAWYGQSNAKVYYNLDKTLPDNLPSSVANKSLKSDYNIVSPEIILIDKNLSNDKVNEMTNEIKKIKGVDFVISPTSISEIGIPEDLFDEDITNMIQSDKYKMIIINSTYDIATNKLNNQIDKINTIIKNYDKNAILAGEGPLMKDLVEISDIDFHNVNYASIIIIVILMLIVLKSYSLPILLIIVIEFAIFVNMAVPYYANESIPFIASIVIGTIQLGATIDYAILMTTKYLEERKTKDKFDAIKIALDNSVNSIFVSGMCFFAATFGVGVYSKLEMIGSLCTLISRGAIISMLTVIMILPAVLIIFDKLICKTTKGFNKKGDIKMKNKKILKTLSILTISGMLIMPYNINALTKEETVYTKLKNTGEVKNITVTEHLINDEESKSITDLTNLSNIKNLNGNEKFVMNNNQITWETKTGKDIYYQGKSNGNLPVSICITYKLDGQEMDAKKMLNKKGKVEIEIKLTNNDKHTINGKTVYTPFVAALTTTISSKNNYNVEVTNGKVISNGTSNIVAAISAPGLYDSLNVNELKNLDSIKLTYDTTKFNLNSIYVAITPKILDSNDLDKINEIDKIYRKVDTLANAATQIVSGSESLKNGIVKINDGAKSLDSGAKKSYQGASAIKNAINAAINELEYDDTNAIDDKTLSAIVNNAEKSATLSDEKKLQISNSALQAIKQNDTYKYTKSQYEAGLKEASVLGITDEVVTACINKTAGYEVVCQDERLNKLISAKQIIIVMEETAKQTAVLTAEQTAKETAKQTSEGVAILVGNKVKETAVNKTKESLNTLYQNLEILENGLKELSNGTTNLYNGTNELLNGANNLNDGISKFNDDGIKKITNIVDTDLKKKTDTLKVLKNLSKKYDSYTLKNENTSGTTKFIYLIDGLK